MTPRKRILLVHNFYQIGGGEHTVFENEKWLLKKKGHAVLEYTRSNDELKHSKWKLLLLPFTTIWSFRTFFQVRKIIREEKIEIVHCHNTFPLISPSVYYAARSRKVPVVQTVHNFRFLCPNGMFYCDGRICEQCVQKQSFRPALKNRCYRNSLVQTAVAVAMLKVHRWLGTYSRINYIFLTEFNRSKFTSLIDVAADNVFIKPNFVYGQAEPVRNRKIENRFIYAGRLDENKGISFLLDVWPELPAEYELHIYGDGGYRKACEMAAQQHGNIRYFGFRPQQEIKDDLADAAALVFPSVCYETFGMSWAESFSVGCPVLSADLGNHGSLIRQSQGGLTYESGNRAAFCEAVKMLIAGHPSYSENARRYYETYLSEDHNYEILSDIYDKAKYIR